MQYGSLPVQKILYTLGVSEPTSPSETPQLVGAKGQLEGYANHY